MRLSTPLNPKTSLKALRTQRPYQGARRTGRQATPRSWLLLHGPRPSSFTAPLPKSHVSPSRPHVPYSMPSSRSRPFSGFTLLEVLVALAILAISCTAVIKAIISVQETFLKEQSLQTATVLGADKMAELELNGPESITLWRGRFDDNPDYRWILDGIENGEEGQLTKVTLSIYRGEEEGKLAVFERLFFRPDK